MYVDKEQPGFEELEKLLGNPMEYRQVERKGLRALGSYQEPIREIDSNFRMHVIRLMIDPFVASQIPLTSLNPDLLTDVPNQELLVSYKYMIMAKYETRSSRGFWRRVIGEFQPHHFYVGCQMFEPSITILSQTEKVFPVYSDTFDVLSKVMLQAGNN